MNVNIVNNMLRNIDRMEWENQQMKKEIKVFSYDLERNHYKGVNKLIKNV